MTDVVCLRRVSVRFGAQPALAEVDLRVGESEIVGLVGPSGAGKTSVLRLCNGTLAPSEGEVEVLGQRLAGCTPGQLRVVRRRIGAVHQQLDLVGPLRVVHNVNAGRLGSWSLPQALWSLLRPSEVDSVRAALDRVGLAGKLLARTDRLSGGEQQRVALARVLVQEPDLILADEPVSSLDPARSDAVMDLLTGIVADRRRTLIVSLHDFAVARRVCDRLVGIRAGRVVFDLPAGQVSDRIGDELYRIAS
jgi:phosphonate transport system ATP-binding protein